MDVVTAEALLNLLDDFFDHHGIVFNVVGPIPKIHVYNVVPRIAVLLEDFGCMLNGIPVGPGL